jgi:hypothetical protein
LGWSFHCDGNNHDNKEDNGNEVDGNDNGYGG